MKIDIMSDHARVQNDGDQSRSGQYRDDADIDTASGQPFHSAALQREKRGDGVSQGPVRTGKILIFVLEGCKVDAFPRGSGKVWAYPRYGA